MASRSTSGSTRDRQPGAAVPRRTRDSSEAAETAGGFDTQGRSETLEPKKAYQRSALGDSVTGGRLAWFSCPGLVVKGGNGRIKQRPEDFRVTESWRCGRSSRGRYRVYLMDKQKLSTFEAVDQIRQQFGLARGSISFCGLKDKQGRTEQLIAVDGEEVELQEPRLRLKYLGRTDEPLTAANTTSNRFSVTVRALTEQDLGPLNQSVAEVSRLGAVNYFDSQRFGSLKHGQSIIAKNLIQGDFEATLPNYLAKPSPLHPSHDAKVNAFWGKHWA